MSDYASHGNFETYADALERDGLTVGALIVKWHARWQNRRALEEMPTERLVDIGMTREEALHEAAKPFWRA